MASEHLQSLLELGFESLKAQKALKATNHTGVEAALDWLEKFGDDPVEEEEGGEEEDQVEKGTALSSSVQPNQAGQPGEMSKGLKCSTCEKLFKNQALASYHSEKSDHVDFEEVEYEVKPLTEEEKQERLERLREQMQAKRLAKQKLEAEEAKANEAIRRKGGKDMNQIKEELKRKEMEKQIAQRKKDKLEDQKAKARVKAEIEADKRERARKAELERSKRLGIPPPQEPTTTSKPKPQARVQSSSSDGTSSKDYTEGRFQLRLPSPQASVIVISLQADETLSDLAQKLIDHPEATQNLADLRTRSVCFSTTYPRKVFSQLEMSKSIKELGLLPSVALAVSFA